MGVLNYTDTAVANCQTYYYKVVTTDTCNVSSAASATATGEAQTNIAPAKPLGLSSLRPSRLVVNLTWSPVTTKVDGTTEYVNLYKIWRSKQPVGTLPASISPGAYTLMGTSTTPAYTDNLTNQDASNLNNNYALFYVVSAADLCGNESVRSDASQVFCAFNGTFSVRPSNKDKNLSWNIMNIAGKDLSITSINVTWSNNTGTHLLETIQYPTGTTVTSFGAGTATPATASYSLFPLVLSKTVDGTCGTCKLNLMLGFDTKLVNATGAGELITIKYNFQDASSVTGSCQFSVFPDLSVVVGP